MHSNLNVPALGLAWANLVTTRIMMHRQPLNEKIRKIELVFSPHTGPDFCYYRITESGIEECPSANQRKPV